MAARIGDRVKPLSSYKYVASTDDEVYVDGTASWSFSRVIARMNLQHDGTRGLELLRGMPPERTLHKLLADCPDFCKQNGVTGHTHPILF